MGQQQLLLIVLGVIIVGIAVVVGINLFNASAEESAKDTVVSEATNIAAMGLQHYKKPAALGGGGGSFDGSTTTTGKDFADIVPVTLTSTDFTSHVVVTAPDELTITSNHNDYDGWTVTVTVTGAGVYSTDIQ